MHGLAFFDAHGWQAVAARHEGRIQLAVEHWTDDPQVTQLMARAEEYRSARAYWGPPVYVGPAGTVLNLRSNTLGGDARSHVDANGSGTQQSSITGSRITASVSATAEGVSLVSNGRGYATGNADFYLTFQVSRFVRYVAAGDARADSDAESYGLPEHVECPFCHRADATELHSPFGPQLSVATYWCRRCRSPFDYIKWQPRRPATEG